MGWLRAARAIGGLLAVLALLVLIGADFWYPGRDLQPEMIGLLLLLIGSLLAVDRLLEGGTVSISFGENGGDNGA